MRMLDNKRTFNGFTIVELTVALTVSAIVLGTGYELFKALRNTASKQDSSMVTSWEVVDALEQLREDLLHALPTSYSEQAVFSGSNPNFETERFKLLEFYSLSLTDNPGGLCGVRQINRIEYELVKENDSMCLYRTAIPNCSMVQASNAQSRKLLLDEIEQIEIFFYNGNKLQPAFSSKEHLPVYVKIELTANGQTWPLAVELPCGVTVVRQDL